MTVTAARMCQRDGCENPIPATSRADAKYCEPSCRWRAYADRQREARVQLVRDSERFDDPAPPDDRLDRLRAAVKDAVQEEKLVAVIAAEARQNWRASAWLLSRIHPDRWGERGRDVPLAFEDDPNDPFREVDELAERRSRRPPGY
jgi:hypothetical protein